MKITVSHIRKLKKADKPFAALTAYDYTSARLIDAAGIPMILVGDSAAMVMLGYETTIPVSVEEMLMMTAAVSRGVSHGMVVADLPFLSYQASVEDAVRSAGRFIKDGRAEAVKLEGGSHVQNQIEAIAACGIPVVGHIGLTPQSYHQMSGYRIQGKTVSQAEHILSDARAVEAAGAFSIVLEGIPSELAKLVTKELSIPTIGIGAGPHCDGQIQVLHDVMGLSDFIPRHARPLAHMGETITALAKQYKTDVESGTYLTDSNATPMKSGILDQVTSPQK